MALGVIEHIKLLATQLDFDFHAYFRNRCLRLQESSNHHLDLREPTLRPAETIASEVFREFALCNINVIKQNFLDLLMLPESAKILWLLHSTSLFSGNSTSILTEISPSLAAIAHIVRGGPNLYKLSGWLIHVLIGYSTVTYYIRRGELPNTIEWSPQVRQFIKYRMQPMYKLLDVEDRMILHVGVLGHDIGVAVDITNHEIHGVPLVQSYLQELNINENTLKQKCSNLSLPDFVWAVQAVIRFHTFANRVAIEYSKDRSAVEIANLVDSASSISWRMSFLEEKFAYMLFLLAVGDLIAVDDTLLNERKVEEMTKGYDTVVAILNGNLHVTNETDEGYIRFRGFLGDRNQITRKELEGLISSFGYNPGEFFTKFYKIQEFNFALSLVRYLPSAATTVLIFLIIFRFIDENLGYSIDFYSTVCVIFDHLLDTDTLTSFLTKFSKPNKLSELGLSTSSGVCNLGDIELKISKCDSESIVNIVRRK